MTHLDNLVADALAQSPDTVVHQLASEVVRLRGAITDALRPLYEGGHIYAKPLEEVIRGSADLKRGGVVVPDITDEDFESVSVLMQENGIGCHDSENDSFRRIVASTWAYAQGAFVDLSRLRTIPADRVLGEGEARIGMNELRMLRDFAGRRMSEREHDRLEAVRDAHEDALRAKPIQEPTT